MRRTGRKMRWVAIIAIALSLITAGCADVADAEDSTATTPAEQTQNRTADASGTTWIAIVMTWRPVIYTIDKEFASEINCWNYYDNGAGESKMLNSYGTQVLDHQGNKPDAEYMKKHRPQHRVYPTRLYRGINDEQGQVWLTCDLKGRYEEL